MTTNGQLKMVLPLTVNKLSSDKFYDVFKNEKFADLAYGNFQSSLNSIDNLLELYARYSEYDPSIEEFEESLYTDGKMIQFVGGECYDQSFDDASDEFTINIEYYNSQKLSNEEWNEKVDAFYNPHKESSFRDMIDYLMQNDDEFEWNALFLIVNEQTGEFAVDFDIE